MTVFWRQKPLTEVEHKLLNLCLQGHASAVHRDNISTAIVRNVAVGSGSYTNAVAAALLSIGGIHAPLQQAMMVLSQPREDILRAIEMGNVIPGWGSSFGKEGVEPIWKEIDDHIKHHFPEMAQTIEEITTALHNHGKQIYPNAAAFSAATAILLQLPVPLSPWLFIQGRIAEWGKVYFHSVSEAMSPPLKPKETLITP